MIPEALYREILRNVPIVCVDVVARRPDGRILLVRRKNAPLKGAWWVIGGRIQLGEKAADAAVRKLYEEAQLKPLTPPQFLGVYEDTFECNSFEQVPYQTFSLVYEVAVDDVPISLDAQSDDYTWVTELPQRFAVQQTRATNK